MRHLSRAVPLLALALLATTGCGQRAAVSGTPVIRVSEKDFHIKAPEHVPTGDVRLRVLNEGPDTHELLVIRLAPKGSLALRRDGLTVNEEAVESSTLGILEGGERGTTRDLAVHLTRGRYILICNMAGHYLGGMHRVVVAS
jgi:hypothetical protein